MLPFLLLTGILLKIITCKTVYLKSDSSILDPDGSLEKPFNSIQLAVANTVDNDNEILIMDYVKIEAQVIIAAKAITLRSSTQELRTITFDKSGSIALVLGGSLNLILVDLKLQEATMLIVINLINVVKGSKFYFKDSTVQNFNLPAGVIFFIYSNDGDVYMQNVSFSNINLKTSALLISTNSTPGCCDRVISINNCSFSNILQSSSAQYPTILIKDAKTNLSISSCDFLGILSYTGFVAISNSRSKIEIVSNTFSQVWVYIGFFQFSLAYELLFINNTCTYFNMPNKIRSPLGGAFLMMSNIPRRNISKLNITEAYSDKTTVGVKISDSSSLLGLLQELKYAGPHYVSFSECTLQRIYTFYEINKESGGAIIIGVAAPIFVHNSTFKGIYMNSSSKANEKVGGPALLSGGKTNEMYITSCFFIDNHSRYASSGIIFLGAKLSVKNSTFNNNNPIFEFQTLKFFQENAANYASIMDLHFEVGGSLLTMAENVEIEGCFFSGNMGYLGGSLFVNAKAEKPDVIFRLKNCNFQNNTGGIIGGAIGFYLDFRTLDGLVDSSSFTSNHAYFGGALGAYYSTYQCVVRVENCYFTKNLADYASGVDSSNRDGIIYLTNNTFFDNIAMKMNKIMGAGSALKISGTNSTVISIRNRFLNNLALSRGVLVMFGGLFKDYDSLFNSNWALDGASAYCLSAAKNFFFNTIFINETSGKAGTFVVKELTVFILVNVTLQNCVAGERGGIFVFSERSMLSISFSKFINNRANTGSILYSFDNFNDHPKMNASLVFSNCLFKMNTALTGAFDVSDTHLYIINCTVLSNTNNIFNLVTSLLKISNLNVSDNNCSTLYPGCVIRAVGGSKLTVSGLNSERVENTVEGGGIFVEDSDLILIQSTFNNVMAINSGGSCLISKSSNVKILASFYKNYNGNCLSLQGSNITLDGLVFANPFFLKETIEKKKGTLSEEAVLLSDSNINLLINNCTFDSNGHSANGGAIRFLESMTGIIKGSIAINTSKFINNTVYSDGGAIHINDVELKVVNCIFIENKAERGGAIFFSTEDGSKASLQLQNNSFIKNQANLEGGAIKATLSIPNIENNSFDSNNAFHGENLATYPYKLRIRASSIANNESLNTETEENVNITVLSNISSGNEIPYKIVVDALDMEGRVLKSLNDNTLLINFLSEDEIKSINLKDWDRSGYNSLPKPVIFKEGKAVFYSFVINTRPNNKIYVKFSTNSIKRFYSEYMTETLSDKNFSGAYFKVMSLNFQDCLVGELYISAINTCSKCVAGKYSLGSPDTSVCFTCPSGAECPGGSLILPNPGHWKSSENSSIIHDCNTFKKYCLGYTARNCSLGYTGPLCSSCDTHNGRKYSRLGTSLCVECLSMAMNLMRILFVFVIFIILIWIMVNASHKEALRISKEGVNIKRVPLKKFLSIYLKIFLNYIQTVSIIGGMDLRWPIYVESYLSIQSNVGEASSQIISIECLMLDMETDTDPIYLRGIAAAFVPIMILLIFFSGMLIKNKIKGGYNLSHYIICYVVVNVFLQPTVLKELTKVISCEDFENGQKILREKSEINCESEEHLRWARNFVYPILAYYCVLYPLGCLFYLIKNKSLIDKPVLRMKFGFFLNGYKTSHFFWEFFIMYRKMLVILIALVLDMPIISRATLIILICYVSLHLTATERPFLAEGLNDLETKSNLSSLITVYSGLFYLSLENDFGKAIMFIAIIITNIRFFYIWLKSVMSTVFSSQLDKIYKLFPKIFQKCAAWEEAHNAAESLDLGFWKTYQKVYQLYKIIYNEYKMGERVIEFDKSLGYPSLTISPKSKSSPLAHYKSGFSDALTMAGSKRLENNYMKNKDTE